MQPGKWARRLAGRSSIAAPLLVCALLPAPASAAVPGRGDGDLSPRLAELARSPVRVEPRAAQAARLSVAPRGPGSLLRQGGRVLLDVRFDRGAVAGLDQLRAAGARVLGASRRYQTVTVAASPADLGRLAAVPRVDGVSEVLAPLVLGSGEGPPIAAAGPPCLGAATSEGDTQLRAAEAREAFGVDGSGATVGILSDSFDRDASAATDAAEDVASGDLPGGGNPCGRTQPVQLLEDPVASGADEGRAMAQIVHDLAPGAALAFVTAFTGELGFAANIERLAKPAAEGGAGADAIVDDIIYFNEPFFQDGPVAVAANQVSAAGVAYFSAAGNSNLLDAEGNEIASWEAPAFRDAPACPAALEAFAGTEHCMDFDPGAGADSSFGITVGAGETLTVDMQWAEPWGGVATDLDVFLLDADGAPLKSGGFPVGGFGDNVGVSQQPVEVFAWENKGGSAENVQLVVNRCFGDPCNPAASSATSPRLKLVLLQNGGGVTATEYPQSAGGDTVGPTVFGHSGAPGAVGVGAVPYSSGSAPERYSSRGPVSHYFGPVQGAGPAAPLEPAQVLAKPDLVATDGGANTFFGLLSGGGVWRFYGTSAAAPHAAAVAALMLEASPASTPAQLRAGLAATARPVGAFEPDAVGAGLVDALGAVAAISGQPPLEEGGGGEEDTGGSGGPTPAPLPAPGTAIPNSAPRSQAKLADRVPPRTFIRWRPRRVLRTRFRRARAVFWFGSDERNARFLCWVDRGPRRLCKRRFARRYPVGRHVIRVVARDAAGNLDRTPAVFRFRVKRRGGSRPRIAVRAPRPAADAARTSARRAAAPAGRRRSRARAGR